MSEPRWIALSPDVIAPSTHPTDATWATESPSPYDVPSHIRSNYDPISGLINIEFRYIESEPLVELSIDTYSKVSVGKRSRRIWSIVFDIHTFNRDRRRITETALQSINSLPRDEARNREITVRAIKSKINSLFENSTLLVSP